MDLAPTPTNLDPIHVSADDFMQFIRVQQWVLQHLNIKLPLLQGVLVAVSTADLQHPNPAGLQDALLPCMGGSSSGAAALAAGIPWRLRQVSAVEAAVGADPADAAVTLGGPHKETLRAGAVWPGMLADLDDCEVS